ncbi:hypothetical protein JTE88_00155 [Arcanobacterium phocisimile]|uniref:Lipoprotein n=1 Tax=Arcanobacterium phocisimile TaxID=1302235 RepID=A0ABX7IGQ4_9ACTO|nr:hypothetical protein [Arcanobacterium phocisimile]QRV02212.1 hypothetical protein JTE88_00155 [Arcanobacterium phocisimile]
MKKVIAGVCVLAFSIAGLAGCSDRTDKEAIKDKLYSKFTENVPTGDVEQKQVEDFGHCFADGVLDELNDEQAQELDKALDKEKLDQGDVSQEIEDVLMKNSNECAQNILMGDK